MLLPKHSEDDAKMAYVLDTFQELQSDLRDFRISSLYVQRKVIIKFRKLFPECYISKPVHSVQILKKELFVNGLMGRFKEYLNMDGEMIVNTKELLPRSLSQVCGPK